MLKGKSFLLGEQIFSYKSLFLLTVEGRQNNLEIVYTVELQWLEHRWDHGN